MKTLRLQIHAAQLKSGDALAAIETAAAILRSGGIVAFPTETVYGLGANALNEDAVRKIFIAKQRPQWDPLIVHIASREMIREVTATISKCSEALIEAFWPGPLTLLLPRTTRIPALVTAGRALVGVRMPSHPVAVALIAAAGVPIAAPSANLFGRISPTLAMHVLEDLDGRIDAVLDAVRDAVRDGRELDGGGTAHGVESTVVDASGAAPIIYRPGAITLEQICAICPGATAFSETTAEMTTSEGASLTRAEFAMSELALPGLASPGLGLRHYAPRARLVLIDGVGEQQRLQLARVVTDSANASERVGVMLPDEYQAGNTVAEFSYRWGRWSQPEELAHRLFAGLRALDAAGATVIVCPLPADAGIGAAIRDRLLKAARPQ